MAIRRYAAASDRDRVLAIWLAASRTGHPFLTEADLAAQRRLVRDVYLEQSETWVAVDDGAIQGFIGLLDSFIGGLFVDPARHGRGVGSTLVHHAAALKGTLTVDVYAANTGALAFYARLGFTPIGRREADDEGRPLQLVQLRRPAD
jgi:putative acetyltransferase